MTDQPETMEEYLFKKLARLAIVLASVICATILLGSGAVAFVFDPAFGSVVMAYSLLMALVAFVFVGDNPVRRVHNAVFSDAVTEIQRPDETVSEVVADD